MTETKYGKYFSNIVKKGEQVPYVISMNGHETFGGVDLTIRGTPFYKPRLMHDQNHAHPFEQFLLFLGGDLTNFNEFAGEVELSLGVEQEKHLIHSPTIVHIPAGLGHCPLDFKKVEKPVLFLNITLTPTYTTVKPLSP
jgi:hypothetical protein